MTGDGPAMDDFEARIGDALHDYATKFSPRLPSPSESRGSRSSRSVRGPRPLVSAGTTTLLVIAVVVVGLVVVALTGNSGDTTGTAGGGSGALSPRVPNAATNQPGDHWHTYLGINICGEWIPVPQQFEKPSYDPQSVPNVGIHTHGDGLIHVHPFVESETGDNATLGLFLRYLGWTISDDTIDYSRGYAGEGPASDPTRRVWRNGETCTFGDFEGQRGEVVWSIDGEIQSGNPSAYKLQEGATIAIGFLPDASELGFPPDACNALRAIGDQNEIGAHLSPNSPCRSRPPAPIDTPTSDDGETTTTTEPITSDPTTRSTTTTTPPTTTVPTGRYYYDGPCPPGEVPSPVLAPPDCVAAKS